MSEKRRPVFAGCLLNKRFFRMKIIKGLFLFMLSVIPFLVNSKPVFIGDSLTYQLAKSYQEYAPVDAHFLEGTGLQSKRLLDWQLHIKRINFDSYDAVYIVLGTNDLISYSQIEKYQSKSRRFINEIKKGNKNIFWLLPPTLGNSKNNTLLNNTRIAIKHAAEKEGVTVIDMRLYLGDEYTEKNNGISIRTKDGIHITPAGADLIVKNLIK